MKHLLSGLTVGALMGAGIGLFVAHQDASNEKQHLADFKSGFLQGCHVYARAPEQVTECQQLANSGSK